MGMAERRSEHVRDGQPMGIQLQFMVSRDGRHWHRPFRQPFLPISDDPSTWIYNGNKFFSSPPVRRGDELWFYFTGYTPKLWKNRHRPVGAVCLGTLRVDGWVSVEAGSQMGTVTTVPLILKGDQLHINCDADNGSIKLELLDIEGHVIDGFCADECRALNGDHVDVVANWRPRKTLPEGPVRIRFLLENAELYSFLVQ